MCSGLVFYLVYCGHFDAPTGTNFLELWAHDTSNHSTWLADSSTTFMIPGMHRALGDDHTSDDDGGMKVEDGDSFPSSAPPSRQSIAWLSSMKPCNGATSPAARPPTHQLEGSTRDGQEAKGGSQPPVEALTSPNHLNHFFGLSDDKFACYYYSLPRQWPLRCVTKRPCWRRGRGQAPAA